MSGEITVQVPELPAGPLTRDIFQTWLEGAVFKVAQSAITALEIGDGTIPASKLDLTVQSQLGVQDGSITNIKLATAPDVTVKANVSGGGAAPQDVLLTDFFGRAGLPADGRLTLGATSFDTADATPGNTLYYRGHVGNRIALYDGSAKWQLLTFTDFSVAVPVTTGKVYDVFVYNNAGVAALYLLVWANTTTRATALTKQDGVWVLTGDTTKRYVGTIYVDASGTVKDGTTDRHVWNFYNREVKGLQRADYGLATYAAATWREWGGSSAKRLNFVTGMVAAKTFRARMMLPPWAGGGLNLGFGSVNLDAVTSGADQLGFVETDAANYVTVHFAGPATLAVGVHYVTLGQFGTGSSGGFQSGAVFAEWPC
jgi:hypothetical protein